MASRKTEFIITCNGTNVQAVIEGIDRALAALVKEERDLLALTQKQGYATKEQKKRMRELESGIDALRGKYQQNVNEMKKYGEVMKDLAGAKTKDLKRALQECKRALDNMSAKSAGRQNLINDMQKIQKQIDANTASTKKFGATSNSVWQTAVRNITAYVGVMAGFNKLKSLVEGVFSANVKLSDSLADIRKVSGLAMSDINKLYENISKIDSRNTIEVLNKLAYTGAKLGIGQNYGVEGLTGFVKAAEQVQMALGEDMGEKALPELAKMTEVMGLIEKYGVEQSMQKAASAIFQLGATSTATGTNIVEFSKRLYGLANVSRISSDELLALGSAADAMGLMPEVAATAFNKLFTSIQKNHNMIEKTLGLQEGLIKNYYTQGKTMDAVVAIFDKMNKTGNLNLLGSVFKDLGSDGARLVNVMATMSDRVDILKKHLEVSRDAFKEGEAVIGEYMIQNQTAAAMLERASNLWVKAFVNPEGVDMVKELAEAWYEVSKSLTQSDAKMQSLRSSISAVATGIGTLIKLLPLLIRFGLNLGIVFGFKAAISGVSALFTSFRSLYTSVLAANGALATTQALLKSNAFMLAVTGIASLITLLIDYTKAADEAAKREVEHQAKLRESYNKSRDAVNNCVKPLESYKRALDKANLSEEQKMQLVKEFKNSYQDYLDYLGIEVNSALDLANAYGLVVKVMKQKKAYEERENYRTEVNGQNRMDRISAQAKVEAEARTLGIEGANKAYLESTQNVKSGNKIIRRSSEDVLVELLKKKYGDNVGISASGELYRIETIDANKPASAANQRITNIGVNANGLRNAIRTYIQSFREEKKTDKDIDAMFNTEYQDIGLAGFDLDEFNRKVQEARWKRKGTLENEAPDKDALKKQRADEAARRKALRAEMKEEQAQAKAIIDNVKNYYERQINSVINMATDAEMSKEQQDQIVIGLQERMNTALANVRKAIGGTKNEWEAFKQTMRDDLYEPLNENNENFSTELLDNILDNNLIKLREMIKSLSKELNQQGNVLLDQILRKATENEGRISIQENKLMRAREKELLEKNYTGKVDLNYQNTMEQFGIGGITTAQSRQIRDWSQTGDKDSIAKFFADRERAWLWTFENARENIIQIMNTDITSEEDGETLLKILFGPAYAQELSGSALEGLLDQSLDQWKVFYQKLIEYNDAWTDAQKKAYDEYKKREDYLFDNRSEILAIDQLAKELEQSEQGYNRFGENASFGRQMGLVDNIQNDPEIMRLQLLQSRAEMYYNHMKELREKDKISEEQLQSAKNSLAAAEMATNKAVEESFKSRSEALINAVQPISDFAEQAGEKLGDMMFNMQSQSMTWNEIWRNMVLAMGKSVIQMGQQYAIQKLQRGLFNKQVEADEQLHQTLLTTIALSGALARMQGEIAIEQGALVTKKVIDGEEITEEVTMATILTQLGISEGAAKTIGKLGWWGIPLVAVISSLLLGLLTSALSTANSSTSKNSNKVKLVSGMLTYDEGNVGQYVGNDGNVYTARQQSSVPEGVSLVSQPIATTINGQPSLVAEKGPEIVIGRRTTRQIMMNEPALLHHLANYGGGGMRRLYDEGNVGDLYGDGGDFSTALEMTSGNGSRGVLDGETAAALRALPAAMAAFSQMMGTIQKQGIPAKMARFGEGSLDEGMRDVEDYRRRYPRQ